MKYRFIRIILKRLAIYTYLLWWNCRSERNIHSLKRLPVLLHLFANSTYFMVFTSLLLQGASPTGDSFEVAGLHVHAACCKMYEIAHASAIKSTSPTIKPKRKIKVGTYNNDMMTGDTEIRVYYSAFCGADLTQESLGPRSTEAQPVLTAFSCRFELK